MEPAARYMDLRTETTSLFEKVGEFLADLCDGSGAHQDAAEASRLDSSLGSFHESFSRLQARYGDESLTVAVLALTKSGRVHTAFRMQTLWHCTDVRSGSCLCLDRFVKYHIEARKLAESIYMHARPYHRVVNSV